MRYTNDYVDCIQDYLSWFEKELGLNIFNITKIEYKLADIFKEGYELGQSERSELDYDEGYKDGENSRDDEEYDD